MIEALPNLMSMTEPDQSPKPNETAPTVAQGWLHQLIKGVHLRPWHLALGAVLSALFLWLAFRQVSLSELSDAFTHLDWRFVGLSLFLSVIGTLFRSGRWRLLYYPQQSQAVFTRLSGLLFFSQMLNLLIPARLGELARMAFNQPFKPARTLGSIAVEKLLDLLTLLSFLLVLPLAISLPDWFRDSRQSFLILTLTLFGISLVLFLLREKLITWLGAFLRLIPGKWGGRLQNALDQALAGLDVFNAPLVGVGLQAWSFLVWVVGALLNYTLFQAFHLGLPLSAAIFLLLVLQVGITVPAIPGKLGVFQYLVILALSTFNVEKDLALSYSLLLYLVAFGPHILFGTLFGILEFINLRGRKTLA